jgi:HAD superfamily hydrolase (TIGR01509 family)
MTMTDLRLVIFDCDGVLVDSESISNRVLAEMLSAEGLPTTLAQARSGYPGLLRGDLVASAQANLGRPLPLDWLERFENRRAAAFRSELRAVPGASEAVRQVRLAGVAVCVASQAKLEQTRLSLELTGLRGLFADHALFSGELVPRGKPHPDLFLNAASRMGATPAQSVVVEDSPSGVSAAVSARMRVLGYDADSDSAALRLAGAEILHSLDELPGRLELL